MERLPDDGIWTAVLASARKVESWSAGRDLVVLG
jgi:hypothetical protein